MPPKKDKGDEKNKKDDASAEPSELAVLQGAKQDLELGHAILADKLRQCQAENERLLQEIERFKARVTNATQDYVDILQHREEQVKAADARATFLNQQVEKLQAEISNYTEEIVKLKDINTGQSVRLEDASVLLADKDKLEEAVRKQHELIERQGQEAKVAKAQIDAKDAALDKAMAQIEELGLRCQTATQLKVLFNETWLVQTTRVKLSGSIPYDRELNTLACSAGGKQLVLYGGQSRTHESVSKATAVLSLDGLVWEQHDTAAQSTGLWGHSATAVGRNKLLVFGGSTGEDASAAAHMLSTDTIKWSLLAPSSANQPPPRLLHAAVNLRDKVYVFGGMTIDGHLLNDLWVLDNMQWSLCVCFGVPPTPRKGASLCATEDGRRLYVFGGHDGSHPLNDCFYCEVERLMWSPINPGGCPPEPRENHVAAVLGKFMFVSGGCGAAAPAAGAGPAGGGALGRRLSDTYVLDMFSGPAWEQLDDGASGSNLMWLKQMSTNSVMHGNKLYTLQPNLHEQLDQLLVLELTLPEDIEHMKTAKKRDQEQVDQLELLDDAPSSSTSIVLAWRPPSKNNERITGYKLMIASCTGVVREVYKGTALMFMVHKLQPAAEYVFCVKATYDDGSYIWSQSKAFHTKMA